MTTFRCDIKEGDKIIFTNIRKLKKMPKTKNQGKYVGPFTASKIMDSHVVISHEELGSNKDKKVPIHITRVYHERKNASGSRKRNAGDIVDCEIKRKKASQSGSVCNAASRNRMNRKDNAGDVSKIKNSQSQVRLFFSFCQ